MNHLRYALALAVSVTWLASTCESRADPESAGSWPRVGGHVGAVLPLFTADSNGSQGIGDFVTVAIASGVTVKLSDAVAVDLENVVSEPLKPRGQTTGLTIDPGVIYDLGPIAVGARLAYQVGAPPNIGVIPLVHKGFPIGPVAWFIEADFPMFDVDGDLSFAAAVHTGIGF